MMTAVGILSRDRNRLPSGFAGNWHELPDSQMTGHGGRETESWPASKFGGHMSVTVAWGVVLNNLWFVSGAFAPIVCGMIIGAGLPVDSEDPSVFTSAGMFLILLYGICWQVYWCFNGWPV